MNSLWTMNQPFVEEDRKTADAMTSYWTNLAATGDPNGKDCQNGRPLILPKH
jgi:hypothetical protein